MWNADETAPQRSADAAASPCSVVWTSAFPSTESESSEFSHSWKITLTQVTTTSFTGRASFHAFPGGGRANYTFAAAPGVLGNATLTTLETQPGVRLGALGNTVEKQTFKLRIGHPPEPNLVGTSDLVLSDLEILTFPVHVGEVASFSFKVRNAGPEVVDLAQASFTIGGVNAPLANADAFPGPCVPSGSGVVCDLGRFTPSQEQTFQIDLMPAAAGDLELQVRLRSSSRDPVPLNNVDDSTLLIRVPPEPEE